MYTPPQKPCIEWDPRVEYALRKQGMSAREVEAMLREDASVTDEAPFEDKVTFTSVGTLASGIPICVVYDQYPSGAIRISDVYRIAPETLQEVRRNAR